MSQGAPFSVRRLTAEEAAARIEDLAALRIRVFADFPYLYAGDAAYERDYLSAYLASSGAAIIGAFDAHGAMIGAATAAPIADHADAFAGPLAARGHDLSTICYFGESVLLPEWRGRGIGHAFFDAREDAARALGLTITCFCAVVRAADHPARPADYRPLDPFWMKRGYSCVEGLEATFDWPETPGGPHLPHVMRFWLRTLD